MLKACKTIRDEAADHVEWKTGILPPGTPSHDCGFQKFRMPTSQMICVIGGYVTKSCANRLTLTAGLVSGDTPDQQDTQNLATSLRLLIITKAPKLRLLR